MLVFLVSWVFNNLVFVLVCEIIDEYELVFNYALFT